MNKIKKAIIVASAFAPMFAMAEGGDTILEDLAGRFSAAVAVLVPAMFGLISVVFLYGVVKFILAGQDDTKRKSAKQMIVYSVVGMFVAVAIWGIVGTLGDLFNVTPTANRVQTVYQDGNN